MLVTYLAPPLLLITGSVGARITAGVAWLLMTIAYLPTIHFYRLSPLWAVLLPLTALIYTSATLDSARRYWLDKGGEWKGRVQTRRASRS